MKIKWSSVFIALFCAFILGYSVYNDCSYQDESEEQKSANQSMDSLLQENLASVDSLRSDIKVMNDFVNAGIIRFDSTLQKHISSVDNTSKLQNSISNKITSRNPNQ